MNTNLLLFIDEECEDLIIKKYVQTIKKQYSLILHQIDSITILPYFINIRNIIENLKSNTIILVNFKEQNCLKNIILAIKEYYQVNPQKTDFGLFCKNGLKTCSVIDFGNGIQQISKEILYKLYNINDTFTFSIFGLNHNQINDRIHTLCNINDYDYAIFQHEGMSLITFKDITNKNQSIDFKREFCKKFENEIYCDEPLTIEECIEEIITIRQSYCAIIDYACNGFINDKLDKMNNFSQYIKTLTSEDISNLNSIENARLILDKYNLSFIVFILGNPKDIKLLIIDYYNFYKFFYKGCNNFEYNLNYIYNFVLSKIFIKLHKNTLFFPLNSV